MSSCNDVFLTSRSRTPSMIDVTSQNDKVFMQLPDIIQEAVVSTEFSCPRLRISRVQNARTVVADLASQPNTFMTRPMFFISSRTDSGIDLPDFDVTDENYLDKFGSDLTANFADIKQNGSQAFFQKQNLSNGVNYSLSACATGYIWVYVSVFHAAVYPRTLSHIEIQIGTFALKARAITTAEIPCRFKCKDGADPNDGELSLLFSSALAKYLRLRMIGRQYEEAAESSIKQTMQELSNLRVVDPDRFGNLNTVLRQVCMNAPMPPTSDVSLISRSMINKRWQCWRETSILRKRYFLPRRIIQCFRTTRHDSIDLLSGRFKLPNPEKARSPILQHRHTS